MTDSNIALGFSNLSVLNGTKVILNQVSGYVKAGNILAVLGPSASGKSVLMKALSGRIQNLPINGQVTINGMTVNPKSQTNPIAFCPQEDSLIGELTAREVTKNTAVFKRADTLEVIDADVERLLGQVGLAHVADGIIGTLIFRGLSGGQKRRVEITTELIASPSLLLMDEPTSGLDSSIAFEVLSVVRDLVKNSNGKLSVVLSIHQPNSRILELFDHMLLLDQGKVNFFGSVPESLVYFSRIGFPCPASVTPTDYFLQISDSNFSGKKEIFDFAVAYASSPEALERNIVLDQLVSGATTPHPPSINHVSFLLHLYTLMYREYALAFRDPTLYWFQFFLFLSFAFMVGAAFFQLPQEIDGKFSCFAGGIVWLSLMSAWVHAFKVYHIQKNYKRTAHEVSNNKYSAIEFFIADAAITITLTVIYMPSVALSYFMMGLPGVAFPSLILNYWVTSIAAEAMLGFICKFSQDPTWSMVMCQLALITTMIFSGGVFIPWNRTPDYWIWMQEMTLFTHSSRAALLEVMNHIDFKCKFNALGQCLDPSSGVEYICDAGINADYCYVSGRQLTYIMNGVGKDTSWWISFGIQCAIYVGFKLGILFFTLFPFETLSFPSFSSSGSSAQQPSYEMLQTQVKISPKEQEEGKRGDEESADNNFPPAAAKSTAALTWTNLSVVLPKTGAKLVDDVSGYVSSGRMLALMGPSGAGKTTLLNALAGQAKYADVTGNVMFSGRVMTPADLTYVPQFDELNEALTVYEILVLVGKLTCTDTADMLKRADMLLNVLGLAGKRNFAIKTLSGGEMKRVSVGIGMITNANILFLDEPTTGLDSTAAYSIVQYLSVLARATSVAIIMTIHQPSALVFALVDDLYLLESGRLVFAGSIPDAEMYFSSIGLTNPMKVNPADYYLDLAQHSPKDASARIEVVGTDPTWTDLFMSSSSYKQLQNDLTSAQSLTEQVSSPQQPDTFTRCQVMCSYFLMYLLREPGFYLYRSILILILGIFVGTMYISLDPNTDDISMYVGATFFGSVSLILIAVASTALFAKDRREAVDRVKNGIFTPFTWTLSQFLITTLYNFPASFLYSCLLHWLPILNPDGESFVYDVFLQWGHLCLMEATIQITIEVLKNDFLSTTFGMIFVGTNLALAGFFRRTNDMPLWISWMSYVVPMKWSFDGLLWQIFHTQKFEIVGSVPKSYMKGEAVLNSFFGQQGVLSWSLLGALWGVVPGPLTLLKRGRSKAKNAASK